MASWKIVFFASIVAATPVSAEDIPHQLTPDLIQTEHDNCKTSTGYGIDFVHWVDIDGDGRKDVVLDYRAALCGGQPEPYCASSGCLLKVWHAEKGGWHKVFDGRAKSWSVGDVGGKPGLLIDGHPPAP